MSNQMSFTLKVHTDTHTYIYTQTYMHTYIVYITYHTQNRTRVSLLFTTSPIQVAVRVFSFCTSSDSTQHVRFNGVNFVRINSKAAATRQQPRKRIKKMSTEKKITVPSVHPRITTVRTTLRLHTMLMRFRLLHFYFPYKLNRSLNPLCAVLN